MYMCSGGVKSSGGRANRVYKRSGGVKSSGGRTSRVDLLDPRVDILGSVEYATGVVSV